MSDALPTPALPEELQRLILGQRHFVDTYTCPDEYTAYERDILAGIAALVQRVTDAETNYQHVVNLAAVERLPAYREQQEHILALTVRAETAERARDALKTAAAHVVLVWHDEGGQLGPSIHALDLAVRGAAEGGQ